MDHRIDDRELEAVTGGTGAEDRITDAIGQLKEALLLCTDPIPREIVFQFQTVVDDLEKGSISALKAASRLRDVDQNLYGVLERTEDRGLCGQIVAMRDYIRIAIDQLMRCV